jgi:hypothetical protein
MSEEPTEEAVSEAVEASGWFDSRTGLCMTVWDHVALAQFYTLWRFLQKVYPSVQVFEGGTTSRFECGPDPVLHVPYTGHLVDVFVF